ncbi:MAG: acetyl-CoA hydrolase/transferase family protein [Sandaracinaceae bacterium]|nr:acetyl-CoA hydrolase/transferase family protein [Sandaracinaceae bacterium]
MKFVSPKEALSLVRSNSRVFVHGAAATPSVLLDALVARAEELRGVETVHLHLEGRAPHFDRAYAQAFRPNALFCGANLRAAIAEKRADYMPVFLSEIPLLFRRGILPLDVALLHVSPPDAHGYVTLGTSVDAALAAAQTAPILIAQVNPQMPRSLGDGALHVSRFSALVEVDEPLPEHTSPTIGSLERAIGERVAELVPNGATLQVGIGALPDAVLASLAGHRELGVHTEMFTDALLPLIESGVITNEHKTRQRGKTVTSFVMGTRKVYDFIHDNAGVEVRDCSYVNDAGIIRLMPQMTSINSAIEVDLTGQVVADSLGEKVFSGVGGQIDFVRGATLSEGGKAIIALPSQTSHGVSRIVPHIAEGAGVVTTRAHVHYVVTEHGVANLFGKNLRQRAQALIAIADPAHRDALGAEAARRFG